jgi:hypothetical protein
LREVVIHLHINLTLELQGSSTDQHSLRDVVIHSPISYLWSTREVPLTSTPWERL